MLRVSVMRLYIYERSCDKELFSTDQSALMCSLIKNVFLPDSILNRTLQQERSKETSTFVREAFCRMKR